MKLSQILESSAGSSTLVEAASNVFSDALDYNTKFSIANRSNPSILKKFKLRMTKLGLAMHDTVRAQALFDAIKEDFPIEEASEK
jgi:hypothetical protein